jgi:hypothetical protein
MLVPGKLCTRNHFCSTQGRAVGLWVNIVQLDPEGGFTFSLHKKKKKTKLLNDIRVIFK